MSTSLATKPAAPAVEQGAFKIPGACQYLGGIAEITLRRLIGKGAIKPCRGLRHILITKVELDRFLAQ
ncbi:MAG: helix-turn-helix domain-containing protein [Rhodospirillales bacterium]|nr:helix-turn-helix domain-containing protein [Acetobacter sp.]